MSLLNSNLQSCMRCRQAALLFGLSRRMYSQKRFCCDWGKVYTWSNYTKPINYWACKILFSEEIFCCYVSFTFSDSSVRIGLGHLTATCSPGDVALSRRPTRIPAKLQHKLFYLCYTLQIGLRCLVVEMKMNKSTINHE